MVTPEQLQELHKRGLRKAESMDCQEYQEGLQKGASNDKTTQKIANVGGATKERGVPRWKKMVAKFF